MLRSFIQIETRRQVAYGTAAITGASVVLSVVITYFAMQGGDEAFVKTGLMISLIVPLIIAPLSSGAILEVLRENFQLNHELKLAAKVAERLAISEATAKAKQSANEALEIELAERKRIEAELRESNNALQSANAVKSRFLASINREIRAPMGDVLGLIETLSETGLSDQQIADLQRSSVALFTTINDILDLSQLEAGEVGLEHVAFDLASCVEDCIEAFAGVASSKGLEIGLNIAPSIPWRVWGDERRLRQVLENLIGNAAKFTHRGRIAVSIAPVAGKADRIRFAVSDTGIGFSEEAKSALFEAFGPAGTAHAPVGAGLGLVISQHLVRLMNGQLTISSQPGKGSLVSFTADFGTVAGTALDAVTDGLRDVRVLLVTSRSSTRHQIGTFLSMGGAVYDYTATPAGALTSLRQGIATRRPFDAVILDLGEGNGDLARSIKSQTAFNLVRLIAIARSQNEILGEACEILRKPVPPDQLRDAIVGARPASNVTRGQERTHRSSVGC